MIIAPEVVSDVLAHAKESFPLECCGVLIGQDLLIAVSVRANNIATNPNRFLIDPRDHFAALHLARERKLEVVGFYHSHPRSEAFPSPTDVAESNDDEAVHLIVGVREGKPEMRLFRIGHGNVIELPRV